MEILCSGAPVSFRLLWPLRGPLSAAAPRPPEGATALEKNATNQSRHICILTQVFGMLGQKGMFDNVLFFLNSIPPARQLSLSWLSLDTSARLTHLCTLQSLNALGTLLQGLGESLPSCAHTHTHTGPYKLTELSVSCHIPMEMAWGEIRMGARSFTNPPEVQRRRVPVFLHPQAISTPDAQHSLSRMLLIWSSYKDDIRVGQARKCPGLGRELLPDRCHLQSAQAFL